VIATGINDPGGKFATGINNTGGKSATGGNDTSGIFYQYSKKFWMKLMLFWEAWGKKIRERYEAKNIVTLSLWVKVLTKLYPDLQLGQFNIFQLL
jgi:hypothetical protein